jgi:hypothetical protein
MMFGQCSNWWTAELCSATLLSFIDVVLTHVDFVLDHCSLLAEFLWSVHASILVRFGQSETVCESLMLSGTL